MARREKHLQPWQPPDALAVPLVQLVQRAEAKALAVIDDATRTDALPDWFGKVRTTLDRWLGNALVHEVVTDTGTKARARADAHWAEQVSGAVGRDVGLDTRTSRALLEGWIANNTARIQSLRNDTIARVRADLETAALSGVRPEELAAQWMRDGLPTTFGTLRGRATVIARHQLGMLAAQIAEQQQRALGLDEYMWDDRPSIPRAKDPVHAGRRGARYSWDGPPPGGHPGHRPNCRCRSVAVVSHERLRELGG